MAFLGVAAQAQQPAQYSLFFMNKYGFNPAYAGLEGVMHATGVYRNQWVGMAQNPRSGQINIHTPYYQWHGGLGLVFENDQAGAYQDNQVRISYNYVRELPTGLLISGGLAAGIVQRSLDGNKLITPDGNYEPGQTDHHDPRLPAGLEVARAPNLQAGIYLAFGPLEGGLAVHNLLNNQIRFGGELSGFTLRRTYLANAEYEISSLESWVLTPALLVKTDLAETQIDIALKAVYNNNLFGGVAFRGYSGKSIDAFVLFGGIKLTPSINFAYAYDATLSALRTVGRGSHEIVLTYRFGRALGVGVPEKIIYNPRLL